MKYALKIYESENIIFILFIESIYIDHSDVERNFFEKKKQNSFWLLEKYNAVKMATQLFNERFWK